MENKEIEKLQKNNDFLREVIKKYQEAFEQLETYLTLQIEEDERSGDEYSKIYAECYDFLLWKVEKLDPKIKVKVEE